jgi:hypothetical protein
MGSSIGGAVCFDRVRLPATGRLSPTYMRLPITIAASAAWSNAPTALFTNHASGPQVAGSPTANALIMRASHAAPISTKILKGLAEWTKSSCGGHCADDAGR